ncbi:MAG: pilus assembly protein [Deltaproteobacteria bacterium]|nr:pilus assembly protein [Deltaproteobacteria bacterium]
MDDRDTELGQTLVETVFVLVLLLILILGIAEFARAWYVKNSLNNAARFGARVGAVTSGLVSETNTLCSSPVSNVAKAVCPPQSPGVPAAAKVTVVCTDPSNVVKNCTTAATGDTVTVTVSTDFSTFKILPLFSVTTLSSQASMRYE